MYNMRVNIIKAKGTVDLNMAVDYPLVDKFIGI